jgi:hypothetical protein
MKETVGFPAVDPGKRYEAGKPLGCLPLLRDDVGEVFFDTIIGFVAETLSHVILY